MRLDITPPPGLDGYAAGCFGALDLGRQRMKQYTDGLSPAQLAQVPAGLANSIATIIVHVCGTEVSLAHRMLGETVPDSIKAEYLLDQPQSPLPAATGETVESLHARMDRSRALLVAALGRLSAADLDREIEFSGGRRPTLRWVLALLAYHQSLHLGQIQMVKRLLG